MGSFHKGNGNIIFIPIVKLVGVRKKNYLLQSYETTIRITAMLQLGESKMTSSFRVKQEDGSGFQPLIVQVLVHVPFMKTSLVWSSTTKEGTDFSCVATPSRGWNCSYPIGETYVAPEAFIQDFSHVTKSLWEIFTIRYKPYWYQYITPSILTLQVVMLPRFL